MKPVRRLWPVLYLLGATTAIYMLFSQWAYDDPFITFRYADNIGRGLGFVYNPGERVLSTTTPLFALLLALLRPLSVNLLRTANLIDAFSLAAGAVLLWSLARAWKTPWVGWISLLLYPTFPLVLATMSAETPLYIALCLGAFAAYARQRYVWTAVSAALAVLTRPDGVLVPVVLGIDFLIARRQPFPWRALGVFLTMTGTWFCFAWIYFGSPLPVTLAAKQYQGMTGMGPRFASGLSTTIGIYANRWHYGVEALLALFGLTMATWRFRAWLIMLAWTFLYFGAYSALKVSYYYWYHAPLVAGLIVAAGLGFQGIWELVRHSSNPWRYATATFLGIAILALSLLQGQDLLALRRQPSNRLRLYGDVARWLRANTTPDATVGALEVGIIGFQSQRKMIDFAGLIQPNVARQMKRGAAAFDGPALWAIAQYRPDYVVMDPLWFAVPDAYDVLEVFQGKRYRYQGDIVILQRRPPS